MKGRRIMKKFKLSFTVLCAVACFGIALLAVNCAPSGNMRGSIGVNISDQPVWGPTGYDYAEYYYLPDIDVYYSVSERQYIYRDGSDWQRGTMLPSMYVNYDPYHSYKVVVNEVKPYQNNDRHRAKYGGYRGNRDQPVIRDSHEAKYFVNKDHPEHDRWVREHQH
jgi:hypothetical protein